MMKYGPQCEITAKSEENEPGQEYLKADKS